MSISDAEFLRWLKLPDAAREVLYEQEFAYESGGAPATGTMRFSRLGYRTKATDTPANVNYRPALKVCPTVKRAVDPDPLGGFIAVSVGGVEILNSDGYFDDLLNRIIDGREGRLYIGSPTWARADFRLVQKVLAEVAAAPPGARTMKITVRDKALLLDTDIAGDAVNDERRKPLVFTYGGGSGGFSVEPVVKDAANLEYYVLQNYTSATLNGLYDDGTSLDSGVAFTGDNTAVTANSGTETITFAGHGLEIDDVVRFTLTGSIFAGLSAFTQYWVISAGFTANDFRLSLTKGGSAVDITGTTFSGVIACRRRRYYDSVGVDGTIKLSSKPAGRLIADVAGYSATQNLGSGAVGELLRAMIVDYGGVPGGSVDTTSFQNVDSALSSNILHAGRVVLERENLRQVLRDIAIVAQVCIGEDSEGTFRAFRINLSALSGATPDHELLERDLTELPAASNVREIVGTVAVRSQKNSTPLNFGEIDSLVSVADARAFSAQFRALGESTAPTGTTYSGNWQSYHLTAVRKEVDGAFSGTAGQVVENADEVLGDMKPHVRAFEVETDLRAYSWRLGSVVSLTHRRYGCASGKNFCLIGREVDLNRFRCRLTLLARFAPNTTSSTFP